MDNNNKKKNCNALDLLSELSEPLQHHILKFLTFKEVARTCVLSTSWKQVWCTYPVFIIDRTVIDHSFLPYFAHYDNIEVPENRIRAIDCLEQTLRNKGLLENLVINMVLCGRNEAGFVDRCLCYAIAANVKSVDLDFVHYNAPKYDLPCTVLCGKSLEVLSLQGCRISSSPRTNSMLYSLMKLNICFTHLEDHVLKSILVGCPLLGELCLRNCTGLTSLELFGHEKLKNIDVFGWDIKMVDAVDLINVSSLSVVQPNQPDGFLINMSNCKSLKYLKLERVVTKDDRFNDIISELLRLECLYLRDCEVGEKLNVSSPNLKRLKIDDVEGLVELVMDSPNLSWFTYYGDMINLCSNAMTLSTIELCFNQLETIREYVQLLRLLEQIHGCSQNLTLDNFYLKDKVFVAANELRQNLPSPPVCIPHITKFGCSSFGRLPSISIAKSVDAFLWIFPHTKTLCIQPFTCLLTTCKFSYKKPLVYDGEFVSCCKSVPLLCWEHCIEKVEVKVSYLVWPANGSSTIQDYLKGVSTIEEQYYLKGAEFPEKIDGICRRNM